MSSIRRIIVRALIWLAALAIPVVQLPTVCCGCDGNVRCSVDSGSAGCRCSLDNRSQGTCCCVQSRAVSSTTCCGSAREKAVLSSSRCVVADLRSDDSSGGSRCRCGGMASPAPLHPTTEQVAAYRLAERALADAVLHVSLVASFMPAKQLERSRHCAARTVTAMSCCVSLCRLQL